MTPELAVLVVCALLSLAFGALARKPLPLSWEDQR